MPQNTDLKTINDLYETKRGHKIGDYMDVEIIKPILKIVWKELTIPLILGIIRVALEYFMTFLIINFLANLKAFYESQHLVIVYLVSMILVVFSIGMLRENSESFTNKAKARAGQVLRGIFYKKLKSANYIFLQEADASFVSNVLFFEIDKIVEFVGAIPAFFTTPISFFLSFLFVYTRVSFNIWVSIILFSILLIIKLLYQVRNIKAKIKYTVINSMRAVIINEMARDIRKIKVARAEDIFKEKLHEIREQEIKLLKQLHFMNSVLFVLDTLMPILCSVVTISYFNFTSSKILKIEESYQIVSVFTVCSRPFREISDLSEKFGQYRNSYAAFKYFLDHTLEKDENFLENFVELTLAPTNLLAKIRDRKDFLETELQEIKEEEKDDNNKFDLDIESWELDNAPSDGNSAAIIIKKANFSVDFVTSG